MGTSLMASKDGEPNSEQRRLAPGRNGEPANEKRDKSKLKIFIDNAEVAIEPTYPLSNDRPLKFAKAKITREAKTKLLTRTPSDSCEGVHEVLEENYVVRRTLGYYACRMLGAWQLMVDMVTDCGSRINTTMSDLKEAAARGFRRLCDVVEAALDKERSTRCPSKKNSGEIGITILNTTEREVQIRVPLVELEWGELKHFFLCLGNKKASGNFNTTISCREHNQLLLENLRVGNLNQEEEEEGYQSITALCEEYSDIFHIKGDILTFTPGIDHMVPTLMDTQ
ncbi:hypothetical protein PR048_028416 [Dryococelus australis]|uniref:Uncharacterized protein n=1 Tax=Dryococelus australis TaxID=614101 RepID=A0ABQ9GD28_9NEOP|nr:hypothetical protein PR048_028416 [Dryococelus australis]